MYLKDKITITTFVPDEKDISLIPEFEGKSIDDYQPEIKMITVCTDAFHDVQIFTSLNGNSRLEKASTIQALERKICRRGETLNQAIQRYITMQNAKGKLHWPELIAEIENETM